MLAKFKRVHTALDGQTPTQYEETLPGGQSSQFLCPQHLLKAVLLCLSCVPPVSSPVPSLPFAGAAQQLLSPTTQPRGSKIQFISSN